MTEAAIVEYVRAHFPGVHVVTAGPGTGGPEIAWGDTFFIYDPQGSLEGPQRFPFATIVTKDYGEFDRASNLNRAGVFRLNIGVGKATYESLFGPAPRAPDGGGPAGHDFTVLDRVLPHPVYARQHWVCVLNPGPDTFDREVRLLLEDAYRQAVARRAPGGPRRQE